MPVPQLELNEDIERTLKEDASVQTVAQVIKTPEKFLDAGKILTKDISDAKTTLSLAINTVENISKIDVTNLHIVTRTVKRQIKDASRVIGRLSSDVKNIVACLEPIQIYTSLKSACPKPLTK